ncbi:hypothetical protein L1987_58216 [Smallanthus sonchifolius]|uniref:Uncharacterized protein n=1 Tax=Smallanthus sonchifolius TaxID=185202 RepID=A0ACB9DEP5_9ASTR|nr:hypothetical protein L1987_58216 [Smallanthus sonchifolius]
MSKEIENEIMADFRQMNLERMTVPFKAQKIRVATWTGVTVDQAGNPRWVIDGDAEGQEKNARLAFVASRTMETGGVFLSDQSACERQFEFTHGLTSFKHRVIISL